MERRTFWLLSAAIVLLALVLREQYIVQTVVVNPFKGDSHYYVLYAQHIHLGYFGSGAVPDAYRPPGYPALIALAQLLGGDVYARLLQWQALMGTATVACTIALGRQWLPAWAALLAGGLLAIWPHHIAFSAEVLTEVPYGFFLIAALLVASVAKGRVWAWVGAGLLFAAATMINTAGALIPLIAAVAMIGRHRPTFWIAVLAPTILAVGGWSLRPYDGGSDRVWQNLMQGSQPLYHESFNRHSVSDDMARIKAEIERQTAAIVADKPGGVAEIVHRVSSRPLYYSAWYVSKAWLLWDWDLRISGSGGPYMHNVEMSTFESPPLRQTSAALKLGNPLLFTLAMLFAIGAAFRLKGPARMVSLAFLYVTAVHVVLQAEPRYSIPYRSLEVLLACGTIAWLTAWLRRWDRTPRPGT